MQRYKLPDTIQIGPAHYEISYEDPKGYLALLNLMGEVSHTQRVIHIDNTNPDEVVFETLVHEIMHIVMYVYDLDNEEPNVHKIAMGIAQFLQQLEVE